MRKQQCRTQISFILCQLWGAEEANSLQSYKKKVSEIIKHPAAGLSAHSQTETEWKPLVKFLSDPQSISVLTDSVTHCFPPTLGSLFPGDCVDGSHSSEHLIFRNKNPASSPYYSILQPGKTHGHCQGAHFSLRNIVFFLSLSLCAQSSRFPSDLSLLFLAFRHIFSFFKDACLHTE